MVGTLILAQKAGTLCVLCVRYSVYLTWRSVKEDDPVTTDNVLVNVPLRDVEARVRETQQVLLDVFLEHQRLPQSLVRGKAHKHFQSSF
jgi:hypothetical protein